MRLCREYGITTVTGDIYAKEWVQGTYRDFGTSYEPADLNASMIYLETQPLWTRGLVGVPNDPILLRELRLLERIPGRIGKDQVSHPRGARDDRANAVCGCLRVLSRYGGYNTNWAEWV